MHSATTTPVSSEDVHRTSELRELYERAAARRMRVICEKREGKEWVWKQATFRFLEDVGKGVEEFDGKVGEADTGVRAGASISGKSGRGSDSSPGGGLGTGEGGLRIRKWFGKAGKKEGRAGRRMKAWREEAGADTLEEASKNATSEDNLASNSHLPLTITSTTDKNMAKTKARLRSAPIRSIPTTTEVPISRRDIFRSAWVARKAAEEDKGEAAETSKISEDRGVRSRRPGPRVVRRVRFSAPSLPLAPLPSSHVESVEAIENDSTSSPRPPLPSPSGERVTVIEKDSTVKKTHPGRRRHIRHPAPIKYIHRTLIRGIRTVGLAMESARKPRPHELFEQRGRQMQAQVKRRREQAHSRWRVQAETWEALVDEQSALLEGAVEEGRRGGLQEWEREDLVEDVAGFLGGGGRGDGIRKEGGSVDGETRTGEDGEEGYKPFGR